MSELAPPSPLCAIERMFRGGSPTAVPGSALLTTGLRCRGRMPENLCDERRPQRSDRSPREGVERPRTKCQLPWAQLRITQLAQSTGQVSRTTQTLIAFATAVSERGGETKAELGVVEPEIGLVQPGRTRWVSVPGFGVGHSNKILTAKLRHTK
jgi:hypothetical protein